MKAQGAVFEQVLLFGISVAIFVSAFAIFQLYQAHFASTSLLDHTKAVRDVVHNHLLELTRIDSLNASFTLRLPREISGEYYSVKINNTGITVITDMSGTVAVSSLESLSEAGGGMYTFTGETGSSRGEIIIYKRGYNIIMG